MMIEYECGCRMLPPTSDLGVQFRLCKKHIDEIKGDAVLVYLK